MRSPNGTFPEYHTSADNLDFVRPEYISESLSRCLRRSFNYWNKTGLI